ncbi:MAG: class I SAM-dependent methyltransferase [Parcubacteria group bacterium]|nr:class I SAM-dependent methyltransferase [Parcubacteria group bacterium]
MKEFIPHSKYSQANFLTQKLIDGFYNKVSKLVSNLEANKVLEVGCGHGFSTAYLKHFFSGKHFEASELLQSSVNKAQKMHPEIKIYQESIYDLKRKESCFDLILALEVLEHLEDPKLALRQMHRVSSRYCLVSVPREPLWRIFNMCRLKYVRSAGNTPGHLNHWSKKDFIRFADDYFSIEEIALPLPWMIFLMKKR